MQVKIKDININTIATSVPKNVFDLRDLSKDFGEDNVEVIIKSTGISKVRVADDDKNHLITVMKLH